MNYRIRIRNSARNLIWIRIRIRTFFGFVTALTPLPTHLHPDRIIIQFQCCECHVKVYLSLPTFIQTETSSSFNVVNVSLTLCCSAYQPIIDAVRTVLMVKSDSAGWIWHLFTSIPIIAIFYHRYVKTPNVSLKAIKIIFHPIQLL